MNSVEPRPEAPWIRRNFGGVIFTENFLEREEKEIENLNEVIRANNLKGTFSLQFSLNISAEEIYASLEKTEKVVKPEIKPSDRSSRNELDQAVIIENDSTLQRDRLLDPTILSSDNIQNILKGSLST